ncbi:MAG: metallophosphoesterase [Myxococcota bacterium]
MRWIVGDVQGCARELERLLREIHFDPGVDELWSAGDLINRGPDSLAALRLWWDVGGRGVIGNHEVYALLAGSGVWQRREDTLDALFADAECGLWLERLRALPVLVPLPDPSGSVDTWLVHAGLAPGWADLAAVAERIESRPHDDAWLLSPEVAFATRARCCDPSGAMSPYTGPPEGCPEGFAPWDRYYRGEARIVHGHWAARGCYRQGRTLGLDSGCVWGRCLSAWCHEEDRIVQVPAEGRQVPPPTRRPGSQ